MLGWILYRKQQSNLCPIKDYSIIRLLEAAQKQNITLKIYTPQQFELVITKQNQKSILIDDKYCDLPNFLLPRLGSDTTYFAFAIIRHLEQCGVYVCNTSQSIEIVQDKLHCHQILSAHNLPIPKTMLLKFPVNKKVIETEIGFPTVIKNIAGTEGDGIYLSKSPDQFSDLMELIYSNNPNANIILQEYIKTSHGKDLRIFIVGGRIIGCMQRQSANNSFKANYSKGGVTSTCELTPEIEWLATETARITNLDIAGIDLLFAEQGFKICEANSAPDFKGLEQVTGKVIAEQIIEYILFKVQQKIAN